MSGSTEQSNDGTSRRERIDRLLERACDERASFDPPDDPDDRAMGYLQAGVWPTIEVYVDVVSDGGRLDESEHDRLEAALNAWLGLYARCYGVEVDLRVPVRQAAEVFVDTHNIRDTAQLLTNVPDRARERREG